MWFRTAGLWAELLLHVGDACVSLFLNPADAVNVCSGSTALTARFPAPYARLFFYVTPPCCNPCSHDNETIRYHPSITNITQQPCYTVDTPSAAPEQLAATGHALDPLTNRVVFVDVPASPPPLPTTCDPLTQYHVPALGCVPKSAVDPTKEYVTGVGDPDADHVVHPKTDCAQRGMYTIPSSSVLEDHRCAEYTTCDPAWTYETAMATPTSDRACSLLTPCAPGQRYAPPVYDHNRLVDPPACLPCPSGYYQLSAAHFNTVCQPHIARCPGAYSYVRVPVADMSPRHPTSDYCETATLPPGYVFAGRTPDTGVPIFARKLAAQASLSTTGGTVTPDCPEHEYADYISTDVFVCMTCTVCDEATVTPCGPYTDAVCGPNAEVQTLYVVVIAGFACYTLGAIVLYWLHYLRGHTPRT